MSSDSDDDYMSDKLINLTGDDDDVRPGLLFNRGQKRKHELLKQQEQQLQQTSKVARSSKEASVREAGLSTAIASSNKGFQMLARMGYQPGSSLGRSNEGITEPLNVQVKNDMLGVGGKDRARQIAERQQRVREELMRKEDEFRRNLADRSRTMQVKKDFVKAQRICEELDLKEGIKMPLNLFFWTKESVRRFKKPSAIEEIVDSDEEEELPYEMNEENLSTILEYLRERYFYCIYCAFQAEDSEDLAQNCPGTLRINHIDI